MFSKNLAFRLLISTISVVIAFVGIIILLAFRSIIILVLFISFWIITNFSGGIICSQCPFQNKVCPGVFQLYFMPFLSKIVYKKKQYSKKTIKISAIFVGIFGILYYFIGFISLIILYWNDSLLIVVLILLGLLIIHIFLSFLSLCPNCNNKEKCPMARVSINLGKK